MADTDPTQQGGQEESKPTPPLATVRKSAAEEEIAAKVHNSLESEFQPFNEDTGEILAKAPKDEPKEEPKADQPRDEQGRFAEKEPEKQPEPEPAPEPEPPKTHKVKVLGQLEEVPLEELIRNYQKGRAADIKLQEASRKLKEADEYVRLRTQPSQDAAPQQPAPSQDAPAPQLTYDDIRRILFNEKTEDAAAQFREEFPEIAADPHLMDMAARLEQQRLQTVQDLGEPLGDPLRAYRGHGEVIRKWLGKYKPADTTSQDKVERKKTLAAVPAANARPPAPQPPKVLTISEQIEEERQQRAARIKR